MAEELHELAVKLSPEGAEETQRSLDETSETFEETANTADKQSQKLGDFSRKWQGAMTAILGGLSVAAAGLLSKVPVIGESMAGLELIISSLALKIDEDLRPALSDFNDELIETASNVDEAEGSLGGFYEAIKGVDDAIATFADRELGDIALIEFAVTVGVMKAEQAINDFTGWADEQLAGVEMPDLSLPDLSPKQWIAGITATVLAGFAQMRERGEEHVQILGARVHTGFEVMWDLAEKEAREAANLVVGTSEWMTNKIIDGINSSAKAIENIINKAAEASKDVPGLDIGRVNFGQLDNVQFGRLETRSTQEIMQSAGERGQRREQQIRAGEGGGGDGQLQKLVAALQQNTVDFSLSLDGREVASSTKPMLDEGTNNRGRFAPR